MRNPGSEIRNPDSGIQNPVSGIGNPKNRIPNPGCGIRNPWSGIRNPKTSWNTLHGAIGSSRLIYTEYKNAAFSNEDLSQIVMSGILW